MPSTLAPTPDGRMPYFPALDGIRALCVLLVLYNHLKTPLAKTPWLSGHLGVDFFFLLSGFLITTLLRRERFLTGRLDLRAFYWRRCFRIIPVYLVVLGIYIAVCQLPSQRHHWLELKAGLPWFLTMMNEYARPLGTGNTFLHTWSLGVEEKFYLVWPLLFFVLARTARARALVTVALLAGIVALRVTGPGWIANAYFGLLAGSWTAVALSSRYAHTILDRVRRLPSALVLAAFLIGFVLASRFPDLIVCFSAGAALLMVHLIATPSALRALLAARPMVWLGKRSYSMYLVHVLCLNVLEQRLNMDRAGPSAFALLGGYALTAAVAAILYRLVEQPCRNLGRRWLKRHGEIAAAV